LNTFTPEEITVGWPYSKVNDFQIPKSIMGGNFRGRRFVGKFRIG
jgi:hypothetical protein